MYFEILIIIKHSCLNIPFIVFFSFQLNLIVMVIAVCWRGDIVAVVHTIWIGFFLFAKRRHVHRVWSIYVLYLAILIPSQYLLILGWPPALCKGRCVDFLYLAKLSNLSLSENNGLAS